MTESLTDLSEFHDDVRAVARDILGRSGSETAPEWESIAGSGWLGFEAPGEFDGADASFAEVAVVLREIGRAAAPGGARRQPVPVDRRPGDRDRLDLRLRARARRVHGPRAVVQLGRRRPDIVRAALR